jgi:hypothetical protein
MAPLAVDAQALNSAGAAVISTGQSLGSVVSTLTTGLSGCNGMAGDDPAGAALGRSYNSSASKLLEAMATTRNGLCRLGDGVRMSAHNYSVAEAMSDVSGHGDPLPAPPLTGPVSAGSTPSAVGDATGAPAGWGWVAPYIGMIWPNGDSAKLRAAAAAWLSAGTNFDVTEIQGAVGPMSSIGAQQIPEGPAITAAFGEAVRSATGILQQCVSIAAQLSAYATKIDTVHAAILDLLSRICDPMTGLKEVWEFLTDQDEDEIKKIANDIRTIVNQFTTEVQALCQQIATVLSEASTILTTMGGYAEKEWDHFLHGTDVGRALNQIGQFAEGVGVEVGGMVKDGWTYGPLRAEIDPKGWYDSWSQMIDGMAPLVGLGGDGAPGVGESWKALGKDVIHWDEWAKNPAKAAGESALDLATLALPGGPLSKASKLGTAARDLARGLKEPLLPKPRLEPPRVEPPKATPPTHGEPAPPKGGRPAPAPAPHDPVPHSPSEAKTPVAERSAPGEGPKPPVEPAPPGHDPPPPPPGGGTPPPPPPGGGTPPPGEPQPLPGTPSGESPPPAAEPHQPTATSPSGEDPPPTGVPHEPVPSAPSGDGHLPAASEPQPAATVPSGEGHAPADEVPQPVAAVPSGLGQSPLSGEPLAASAPPALAPVSAGAHSAELAPKTAYAAQPKPAEPLGRANHWPGAGQSSERPLTHDPGPRSGRPADPPPPPRAHGGGPGPGVGAGSGSGNGNGTSVRPGGGGSAEGGGGEHGGPTRSDPSGDGSRPDHDAPSGDDPWSSGLTDEQRDAILAMEKGTRPDPAEYLSPDYIQHHIEQFNQGATRFMLDESLSKYGIGQHDGTTFVFPTSEVDSLIAKGNFSDVESALGLPEGYFKDFHVIRVDIPHPEDYHLRMPSGNEAGANDYWIPGGLLPEGMPEAVIDGSAVPPEDLTIIELTDPER